MLSDSKHNVLIINPNSTQSMTDSLSDLIGPASEKSNFHYFTNPISPASINNAADGELSTQNCIKSLSTLDYLQKHGGFLVACYSDHPLVAWLKTQPAVQQAKKPVTGIFESSVWKSLNVIPDRTTKFGIVSTGKVWEDLLSNAVIKYAKEGLGAESALNQVFAGVETTGLNATDLHDAPAKEVRQKMKDATKRLVRAGDVRAVCLGCAGMAGMDVMVREALIEELGEENGEAVKIVDGVKAGVEWLELELEKQVMERLVDSVV